MEELLIALVLWIGKQIAKAYRKIRSWFEPAQNPWTANRDARGERPMDRTSPGRAAGGTAAQDPYRVEREVQTARAEKIRSDAGALSREVSRSPQNVTIGETLDTLSSWCEEAAQTIRRVPPGSAGAIDLERMANRIGAFKGMYQTLARMAEQRAADSSRALAAGDRMAAALMAPLASTTSSYASGRGGPPKPVAIRGPHRHLQLGLFSQTSMAPVVLPAAFPADALHFSRLAQEVGRDLLDRATGLRWELRSRLGLPDRYVVPFAFRGYWGEDELLMPWGAWLDVAFGDLVGTLLLGPAYVSSLLQSLARPDHTPSVLTVTTVRDGTFYSSEPPAHLRVAFSLGALEAIGFAPEAERVATRWRELHRDPRMLFLPSRIQGYIDAPLRHFDEVAKRLAQVLVAEPLEALAGRSFAQIDGLAFTRWQQERAVAIGDRLLSVGEATESDQRLRLAGALLARELAPSKADRLARWLLLGALPAKVEKKGPRTQGGPAPATAPGKEGMAELFRDAILLDAILNRRPLGSSMPGQTRR